MEYFRRVLRYVYPQYKALIISVVCALLAAALFSFSLVAMLPLMKVMMGEEGLHGWVNRAIVVHRTGISFVPEEIQKHLSDTDARPLRISGIENDSPAQDKGFMDGDVVLSIGLSSQDENKVTRDQLLEMLSLAETARPIQLAVRHDNGQNETISFTPGRTTFYAPAAHWLLGFIPRHSGADFKRNSILLIIVIIMVVTIVRCCLRFIQEYLVKRVALTGIMALREDTYRRTLRLPLTYFSQEGISDTMSRFVQDSNRIQQGVTTLFGRMIREPFKIIALLVWAFKINTQMTLIAVLGAPVAAIIIGKLGRKMKRATKRTLQSWSQMLGRLQGTLLGIRVVKGYHQEEYEQEGFGIINRRLLKQQFRVAKIDAASGPMLESLGIMAACAGMIFAVKLLTQTGGMLTTEFFILVGLLATMAESGRKLGKVIPRLQTANASAQRVYQLYDMPIETDVPNAKHLGRMKKSLEIRNLSFTYPNSPATTLGDINLNVQAGEVIAVVGPNGSGKTTMLSMIPRFFIPDKGQILIDGQDIADVTLASLRQQISIVTQQTVTFNDTIASNIAYGNQNATEEQIVAAAKCAYADEFITNTSDGYQTIIGEQGATLSGGQLQRLAIARAIIRDPAILIFDEAMSQIDSDSEAKIQKALAQFAQGRTSFIIAHRLSTIISADRIVVLDDGKLIDQGKHKQLLQSCDLYRQLYEMQFAGI